MAEKKENIAFTRSAIMDMKKETRFIALRICPENLMVSWDGKRFADYIPPDFFETIDNFASRLGEAKTKRRYLSVMDDFTAWCHGTAAGIMECILAEHPGLEWIAMEGPLKEPAEADDVEMTLSEELLDKFLYGLSESAVIVAISHEVRLVMDMGYQRTIPFCPNCGKREILDFSLAGDVTCPHCGKEFNGNMMMLDALYVMGRDWIGKHPDPGCRIAVL